MATTDKEDLTRPMVNVKVPEVRIKLEDLAYLRSLGQPKSVRCFPGRNVVDRLKFLDLMARANVPPSKEKAAEVAKKVKEEKVAILRAIDREDWEKVHDISYRLRGLGKELKPTEEDELTDRGRELLRQGEVNVKVRKIGCVS